MSYYYNIQNCSLKIPASNVVQAMERLSTQTLPAISTDQDPVDFFRPIGLAFHQNENGDLHLYSGESRYDGTINRLDLIADLVESASFHDNNAYVYWQGEDGTDIRLQSFSDGKATIHQGRVVFD